MASGPSPPSSQEGRVLRFRRRPSPARAPAPVAGLDRYQRAGGDDDNYRHRMLVNLAAFVFVAALIGAGIWLADTMAAMRKNQDCVLAGHRGCTPVDIERR
jgi:hypothetical protein